MSRLRQAQLLDLWLYANSIVYRADLSFSSILVRCLIPVPNSLGEAIYGFCNTTLFKAPSFLNKIWEFRMCQPRRFHSSRSECTLWNWQSLHEIKIGWWSECILGRCLTKASWNWSLRLDYIRLCPAHWLDPAGYCKCWAWVSQINEIGFQDKLNPFSAPLVSHWGSPSPLETTSFMSPAWKPGHISYSPRPLP